MVPRALWAAIFVAGLSGCSVNLLHGNSGSTISTESADSFFEKITLYYGGKTQVASKELLQEYSNAATQTSYAREGCRGNASIFAQVKQDSPPSAWTLGAVVIPFWPILPVDETLSFTFRTNIYCNNTLVKQIEFFEQEKIKATVYGRLRSGIINSAAKEMHKKLVQRIHYELTDRQADLNSAISYNVSF